MGSQYATVEQFRALSLTPASLARFDNDAISANLQAASALADMYLNSQLSLPLLSWSMVLSKAVCDIAAKELFSQYGYNPAASGDSNFQRRYNEAIEWLTQVSKKELDIQNIPEFVDSSGASPTAGQFVSSNQPVGFGLLCNTAGLGFGGSGWDW